MRVEGMVATEPCSYIHNQLVEHQPLHAASRKHLAK